MSKKDLMPIIFIGHGSPMNIIQTNEFTKDLKKISKNLPRPKAILVVSAHWLTRGTYITCEAQPRQIYDYYGFPKELYDFSYQPEGNTELAKYITTLDPQDKINCSLKWGIDHAAFMVLGHIYPDADIPTLELSLDYFQSPQYHYELAKVLKPLREQGVLIIGSGNLIHTFSDLTHHQYAEPFSWSLEFDNIQKRDLINNNFNNLIHYEKYELSRRAFQTNEHYLPMLYILSLWEQGDTFKFIHEGFQHGSISHRSFMIG